MKPKKSKPPREDARVSKSKALVLKTTWDLLSQNGLTGVRIDEVARQSGVAKTTIYRHWKTGTDLLIEACSQPQVALKIPDHASLKKDLETLLSELAELLQNARWASVLPSVIDGAERDEAIASLHGQLQRAHAEPFKTVIERAVTRGELGPKTDVRFLIAMLMGPLFYRRWFSREKIDAKFVKAVVSKIL